jgi:hypothetical protein
VSLCFILASYPPECEKYEVTQNVSEISGLDYCFEVIVNCNDPVNSETLLFKEPSGNGTQLFTLNSDATNNDKISFCTREGLKGKVGQWHVSKISAFKLASKHCYTHIITI